MKRILIVGVLALATTLTNAQDFTANLTTAKKSYGAGKLEDAHFALQQMLVQLDMTIGKEVLKLLPAKMDTLKVNSKEDNVTANISFIGATIQRTYGAGNKKAEITIVNNSPLLGTLNAFLASPLMGLVNNADNKVVKIQGYKSRLTKETGSEGEKPGYKVEIPFSNALITVSVNSTSESEILAMANTIPFADIAKLIQ